MDILLNEVTEDAVFTNSTPALTKSSIESIAQRLKIRLGTIRGEWLFNYETGVDYFGRVFGRQPNKSNVDLVFQEAILSDAEIARITMFESEITPDRRYIATFTAETIYGQSTQQISIY